MLTNISIYIVDVLYVLQHIGGHPLAIHTPPYHHSRLSVFRTLIGRYIWCKLRPTSKSKNERGCGVSASGEGLKWGIWMSGRKEKGERKLARERERENTSSTKNEQKNRKHKKIQHSNVNQQMSFLFLWYSINSRAFHFAIPFLCLSFFTAFSPSFLLLLLISLLRLICLADTCMRLNERKMWRKSET